MDPYKSIDSVSAQGTRSVAITPDDNNDLVDIPKAIFVGTGGNIAMVGPNDRTPAGTVWKNVPSGALLPFRPRRVLAAGTTAADIVAIY